MDKEMLMADKIQNQRFYAFCDKKSFYGKARINYYYGNYQLKSYDTNICVYESDRCDGRELIFINQDFKNYLRIKKLSATTIRHIKCFFNYLHSINSNITYDLFISQKGKKEKLEDYFQRINTLDVTNGEIY